jgi:hypothetical protein
MFKKNFPQDDPNDYKDKIVETNNGLIFMSSKIGKKYVWKYIKDVFECKTPKEYFDQYGKRNYPYDIKDFLNKYKKVAKELKKHNIYILDPTKWSKSYNVVDLIEKEAVSQLSSIVGAKNNKNNNVLKNNSCVFVSESAVYSSSFSGTIQLFHTVQNTTERQNHIELTINIFKKYFSKNFKWSGNSNDAIVIKLDKI